MAVNRIEAQAGAQYKFLSSNADIAIYGGAAGGGKTAAILLDPLRYIQTIKGFNAVIFRKTYSDIENTGGLWDESEIFYTPFAKPTKGNYEWSFPPFGNTIKFRHMQHDKNRFSHQGGQYPLIGFDELTHFSEKQFWYMLSRNRSTCGVRPYVRATCNPDPDSFVASLIDWWINEDGFPIKDRSGALRYFVRVAGELIFTDTEKELIKATGCGLEDIKSLTFIPAKLEDNKILIDKDPAYRSNLLALPEYERQQLLDGNWKIKKQGSVFKNPNFAEWRLDVDNIMYVDPAFGGSNNTSVSIVGDLFGTYQARGLTWREDIYNIRKRIVDVAKAYRVGTIIVETNGDKGASLRELKNLWPAVTGIEERTNKHVRIIQHVYHNWNQILFASDINNTEASRKWMSNILAYEEGLEPDDEVDSLAGAMRHIKKRGSIVMGDLVRK